jgi:hypothetical protein
MSKLIGQLLMLSGFYFILSFILNTWQNDIVYYVSIGMFVAFVLLFVVLCVRKSFSFFEKFDNNSPKVSNYVKAVGAAQYFNILFGMVPGFFVDTQYPLPEYFRYASIAYFVILLGSLIYATYLNLSKKK